MTPSPSLPVLLRRVAAELVAQAREVRDLHGLVGDTAGASAEAVRLAQGIDVSSQHLDDLARLLAELADMAAPETAVPEALSDVMTLSGLRDRLFGLSSAAEGSPPDGELDLF